MLFSIPKFTRVILFFIFLCSFYVSQAQGEKPPKRAHHEMIYDPINKVIMMTGGSSPLNEDGSAFQFYNDIWHFDGKQWSRAGNAGDERSGIRMAYDSKRKQIFTYGGFLYDNTTSADLLVFEEGYLTLRTDDPLMKAAEAGFVYDSDRDKLIVFGGSAGQHAVNNTTWEWDGSSWSEFNGPGPEGRQGHIMIYDSKRKKTVLYGGTNGSGQAFDDGVWEYDGQKWLNIKNPKINPGQRLSSGYAYDSKRGTLIVFGGISNKVMTSDTWSWDGKSWKQLAESGPARRVMGYMAYDEGRDRIVLFGGRLGWPNDANDTWEWDGTKWMEIN